MAKTQSVSSMTGFARQPGGDDSLTWAWEVKSVNGRSLDVRCRLPSGYDELEVAARSRAAAHLTRGNLQINLSLDRSKAPRAPRINRDLLARLLETTRELQEEIAAAPPSLDGIMALPGVIEMVDEELSEARKSARDEALRADLDRVLDALCAARRREGARLGAVAEEHLQTIEALTAEAVELVREQPALLRARLEGQIAELLSTTPGLSEERLAQEVGLLVGKADIREELDRLGAHLSAARDLLAGGGAIGRRLDFLCQEFTREANTLCSKSPDIRLTRTGLALKNAIEQLREQVQNIE